MTWKRVQEFAATHNLAIYKPLCGYHNLAQITTTDGKPVSWTSNKAASAMLALQAIVHQKALELISTHEIIMQANDIHSDLY